MNLWCKFQPPKSFYSISCIPVSLEHVSIPVLFYFIVRKWVTCSSWGLYSIIESWMPLHCLLDQLSGMKQRMCVTARCCPHLENSYVVGSFWYLSIMSAPSYECRCCFVIICVSLSFFSFWFQRLYRLVISWLMVLGYMYSRTYQREERRCGEKGKDWNVNEC